MEIVSYTAENAPQVASFFREIFKELGFTERQSDYMNKPHLLFHLPNKGMLLLVKEKERVVGTAGVIMLNEHDGLIKRFYLQKDYRGTGLAQQLLQQLFIKSKALHLQRLLLDVSKTNTRAIHFYEKSGFVQTTVSPNENWPESNEPNSHLFFYKQLD